MSWRLAVLMVSTLLLGACANQQVMHQPRPELPVPTVIHAVTAPEAEAGEPDLWSRLRQGFAFTQCQDPRIHHWIQHYTRHPDVLSRQLANALPSLDYIANIILDADLPAEFALLPWVESNFRPLPGPGGKAAGMWQIMPATGRELGLRIDRHRDERLDIDEATRAVTRMLWRDQNLLGDWRLTDMAFNAGVYRILGVIEGIDPDTLDQPIPALDLKPVTLDHLAKLQALACIVDSPEQHQVQLPDPDKAQRLVRRELPTMLELPIAARLAGLADSTMHELNPAVREPSLPTSTLIIPAETASHFDRNYALLESLNWQQWQRVQLHQTTTLLALADELPEHTAALALVNQKATDQSLQAGSTLWLPSRLASALPAKSWTPAHSPPDRYTVKSGDSLWGIARRFNVSIKQIRTHNRIRGNLLHAGQELILTP